ncbi:MAG: hypothetical protein KAS32_19635 [Candidatus Peribacteraceae bacterium]|nr:hypothetical protein [Candidatus Peribacteraceae bacterium]
MYSGPYSWRVAEQLLWRERFESPGKVAANGVTLVGAPVPSQGLPLNGTSQYGTKAFPLGLRTEFCGILEFLPNFAHDDGVLTYLQSSTGDTYAVYKDAGDNLVIELGGTVIESIAAGVYGVYWLTGERNRLALSTTGTLTNAWLNGTQILTNDATGWTASPPADLVIGSSAGGGDYFDGTIYGLDYRAGLFVQADIDALESGDMFNWQNRTSLYLDLRDAVIDGTTDHTTDRSPNGHTVLLGDGAGTGRPTFEAPGLTFDDVNDYLTLPADPTGTFTVAWKRRNEDVATEANLTTWNKIKTAGDFGGLLDFLAVWNFSLSPIQIRDLEYAWAGGRA